MSEMNSLQKIWRDGEPVTTNLFDHIIKQRNITNLNQFITPNWPNDLHSPASLPDIDKAVQRVWEAVEKGEKIGIVGDYDMDGTPAAALLTEFFQFLNIDPYVVLPTREEGYGFSSDIVTRLTQSGVKLIITVDCGIRDYTAVEEAKKSGCDIIITDHHECSDTIPDAYAVVNPKRPDSDYPFRELCGTALAFKLCQALFETVPPHARSLLPDNFLAWTLDLVVMATIGDMVPLINENRVLSYYGMKVLRKSKRLGLRRLIEALGLSASSLSYNDVSFKIIPKLNASGRLENMDDVLLILTCADSHVIDQAIKRILARSTQSQLLLAKMVDEAKQELQTHSDNLAPVLLLARDSWHPGLTGLVAMRLAEEYNRPVGILAGVDADQYRGSMRSIRGVSLPRLLESVSKHIEKYGGHDQAAGLTINRDQLEPLTQALSQSVITKNPEENLCTDGTVQIDDISLESIDALTTLTPWGVGNPEPLWSMRQVHLDGIKWLSEGKHLRASIHEGKRQVPIIFFGAERIRPWVNHPLDIYGSLSVNEFRGIREPQLQLKGFSINSS